MQFTETYLAGSFVIDINLLKDTRGWFSRYFCKEEFAGIGHQKEWLQMNHSFTSKKGALRGMHMQLPPFSEIKMVRCVAGSIFDVIIDLRENSPTLLQWFGSELSAENYRMIYIPEGFAHGFQTLSENCELLYHHSANYRADSEKGFRFNDPVFDIKWPMPITEISEKDSSHLLINNDFKGFKII